MKEKELILDLSKEFPSFKFKFDGKVHEFVLNESGDDIHEYTNTITTETFCGALYLLI